MKKYRNGDLLFLLLFLLSLIIYGCSSQFEVFTDADPDMDVLIYKTYAWPSVADIESRTNPLLYNELTDKRIRKAVDERLATNGYIRNDSAADLKIHYHIVVKDKIIERLDDPHGDSFSIYWLENGKNTQRYEEGTLIVDLMDAKSCNLISRGWAVGIINDY